MPGASGLMGFTTLVLSDPGREAVVAGTQPVAIARDRVIIPSTCPSGPEVICRRDGAGRIESALRPVRRAKKEMRITGSPGIGRRAADFQVAKNPTL